MFVAVEAPPGVYIYLGYSKKDALILQRGRVKLGKKVPDTEEEERNEVKNTIQQTVSHFTSNANKVLPASILCELFVASAKEIASAGGKQKYFCPPQTLSGGLYSGAVLII